MIEGIPAGGIEFRPRLSEQLVFHARRMPIDNLALIGSPGFHAEQLFESLLDSAVSIGHRVLPLRTDSVRLQGFVPILHGVMRSMSADHVSFASEPARCLKTFNELGIRLLENSGKQTILALKNFHGLIQASNAYSEEILLTLDSLEQAATEPPMWLVIWACSELEPARVCESIHWSPFYKVFGNRTYFAAGLDRSATIPRLETFFGGLGLSNSAKIASEIYDLSGGIPELVEFLSDRIAHGDSSFITDLKVIDEDVFLVDLRKRISDRLGSDFDRLEFGNDWKQLQDTERSSVHRLRRFGLVTIDDNRWRLATSLLNPVTSGTKPSCASEAATSFVHGLWLLPHAERILIERLCSDTYFTTLSILQHREGEARVLYACRQDDCGRVQRPVILKVHNRERIAKEIAAMERARELLGPANPAVTKSEFSGALGAYRAELACADNREYSVRTFEQVFNSAIEEKTDEAIQMLERLFDRVLGSLYSNLEFKELPPSKFYFVPKVQEHFDLHYQFDKCVDASGKWRSMSDTTSISMPRQAAVFLDQYRKEAFESKHLIAFSKSVHGDLNPRNFLIDGVGNIFVIDFATFGPGPMAKDFARVECEIFLYLCSEMSFSEAAVIMDILFGGQLVESAEKLSEFPVRPPLQTVLRCVSKTRRIAQAYCLKASPPKGWSFDLDYLIALCATSSRLCLFSDYLSDIKAEIAYLYTSFAFSRLIAKLRASVSQSKEIL